ncbi:MAG: hypothetical protein P8Y10_14730 [Gemmatimonadales bacterium]
MTVPGGPRARRAGRPTRQLPTAPTTPDGPARATPSPTAAEGVVPPATIMPPYRLPAEHFLAALGWLALGALGLVSLAPELATGAYLTPRAAAVTHCFTLGWVTTSIFGALYQIYPVALGVGAHSTRIGHLTFWMLQAGIVCLVAGAWWWNPNLLGPGWLLLFLATIALRVNLVARARGATRAPIVGKYATAAVVSLVLALAVIGVSIGSFAGWWRSDRTAVLIAHAHLAAVGFATLIAIGVGGKLLPMFLYARDLPEWPLRWIGPLVGAVALGLLLLLASDPDPRIAAAYGLLGIVGWLTLFVAGVYHRILPFLTWLERFSSKVGAPGVPKVTDLTKPRLTWTTHALLAVGAAALGLAVFAGSPTGAWVGAAVFALGALTLLGTYLDIVRRR